MICKFTDSLERVRIDITDEINKDAGKYDWWTEEEIEGYSLRKLKNDLEGANGKPLDIHINSNGGEVFEGFSIYNALKDYGGDVVCYVDGIAASIASVIALAGNKLIMHNASMFMIHNASGMAFGNAEEMKKVVAALEQINSVIKNIYLEKVNIDEEKLTELMNNETFLTPQQCLEYGFCDEIIEGVVDDVAKQNAFNNYLDTVNERISQLKNVKEALNQVGGTNESVVENEDNAFLNKKANRNEWLRKEFLNEIR